MDKKKENMKEENKVLSAEEKKKLSAIKEKKKVREEGEEITTAYQDGFINPFNDIDEYIENPPETIIPIHWSVPWADLMMVMFIFFAVLFTYAISQEKLVDAFKEEQSDEVISNSPTMTRFKEPTFDIDPEDLFRSAPQNIPLTRPEDIYESSERVIKEANIDNVEVILQEDKSVKLSVRGPMFFDLGKADLKPETRLFLDKITTVLKSINNEVHVVGHTDDYLIRSELYPSNWELSAARASGIVRYLINSGIEPERFTVKAYSKYRPEVPNITPENKARNRRVEIIITRDEYKEEMK
jgi:chemotaxis protein MotB